MNNSKSKFTSSEVSEFSASGVWIFMDSDTSRKESKRTLEANFWHQPRGRQTSATSKIPIPILKYRLWIFWGGCERDCTFFLSWPKRSDRAYGIGGVSRFFGHLLIEASNLHPIPPPKAWGIVTAGASMGGRLCCAALSVVMKTALCFWYLASHLSDFLEVLGIWRILNICASQNMSFALATFSSLVFAHQAPLH